MLFYIWRKVTEILGDMQENGDFFRHFQFRGRAEGATVEGLEKGNLKKKHFYVMGYSFGLPSVVSRSSLGKIREGIREGKEKENLNFRYCLVNGASAYCLAVRGKDV